MEPNCKALKMDDMEQRFGDDPRFFPARELLEKSLYELEKETERNSKLISCYGENLDRIGDSLSKISAEQISARYAAFKAPRCLG